MSLPDPELGLVICYSYLWHSEQQKGHEEGLKDRPCVIVSVKSQEEDEIMVSVVPITHTPTDGNAAIELPSATKRRLNLDDNQSWVVVNEINRFVWPGPDLRPISKISNDQFTYGYLPPRLFGQLRDKFVLCAKEKDMRVVVRTE